MLLSFVFALIIVAVIIWGVYLLLGMIKGLHPNLRMLILLFVAIFAVYVVFRALGVYTF